MICKTGQAMHFLNSLTTDARAYFQLCRDSVSMQQLSLFEDMRSAKSEQQAISTNFASKFHELTVKEHAIKQSEEAEVKRVLEQRFRASQDRLTEAELERQKRLQADLQRKEALLREQLSEQRQKAELERQLQRARQEAERLEREERERLKRVEQEILDELRRRLYEVLNEKAKVADVRDLEVRELEELDKEVVVAEGSKQKAQRQLMEVKTEQVVAPDAEMAASSDSEVEVAAVNVEMDDGSNQAQAQEIGSWALESLL